MSTRDTDLYDFFISYSRKDNADGWVSGFIEGLLAEHRAFSGGRALIPFFDKKDIQIGDDWAHTLEHGVRRSRLFIAFVSPNYFASEWCRREWRAWIDTEIAKHILTLGMTPVHLVEIPGLGGRNALGEQEVARQIAEFCKLPDPHGPYISATAPLLHQLRRRQILGDFVRPFHDDGIDCLRREDLRKILRELAENLDERAGRVSAAAASQSTVPPYNPRFTGRLDELMDLRKRLVDDRAGVVCGVHGLGGIGKTELVFTYAHAFAAVYPGGRFLVPCEGQTTLRQAALKLGDFMDFHSQISDQERMTPESFFAAVVRCLETRLESHGHILLVLDNVDHLSLLDRQETDALTSLGPRLHLLATTRLLPPSGSGGAWLTLGELSPEEALELLERHRTCANETEREAARSIVVRLGGFALGIELVAAFLAANEGATYTGLANGLGLEDLNTLAEQQDVTLRRHNHEKRLVAVLGPVLSDLKPAERRAMEYAALLPPDYVALPWIRALVEPEFPEAFVPGRLIADPWADIVQRLSRLALITRSQDELVDHRLVRVHRLVQDLTAAEWTFEERAARQNVIDTFIRERGTALENTTVWEDVRWELDPLDAIAGLWAERMHPGASWLLNRTGSLWFGVAEWNRAEPLLRRALAIDESDSYDQDHPDVELNKLSLLINRPQRCARDLSDLALLLKETNRFAEAETMLRRALEIDESGNGPDDLKVANHLFNLASVLTDTNRYIEAEPYFLRALAIFEETYGPHHPKVATALSGLTKLLMTTNRLSEAEPLLRRALSIDEASYGLDHPKVAICLNNLAQLLQTTNRLSDAEPLMRRALSIAEACYGPNHPQVSNRLSNLASLLQETNRPAEAEPLMRRALTIDEDCYGPDHPDVSVCLNNLAQLLRATNRLVEAEPLMRRALVIDENSYGPDHPRVATNLNNLAHLLDATNRHTEAEPLMRRALAINEASYGANHPDVARNLNNLAQLLDDINRTAEAEPLMRRALTIFEKCYGEDHSTVATALNNFAQLLQNTDRAMEAHPLMRRALIIFSKNLGRTHPTTETVARNYELLIRLLDWSDEKIEIEFRKLGLDNLSPGKLSPLKIHVIVERLMKMEILDVVKEFEKLQQLDPDLFVAVVNIYGDRKGFGGTEEPKKPKPWWKFW